ncbi:hypothetical protein DM826_12170 [Halonotius aquaticus]|uniref:DUF502 domain-containing protein n=1 Tax=Halonotius aquaticus TaxID=2216978 RepID=A0A3A6Q985_9EURY|nr:DUF502 domain-containing protein [Halonotius aquaticus]RJX42386.1 hypothetical protein DM826_12170 [Halonotius aquaticus]
MPEQHLKTRFLTGIAVVIPLAVSAWVLLSLFNFIGGALSPISEILSESGVESETVVIIIQALSVVLIAILVLVIGTVAQQQVGENIIKTVDSYVTQIPGIGSVYQTTRQMSDLVLDPSEDGAQFREVKLVEFPADNAYTLAFLTSESPPESVETAANRLMGDDSATYQTVFLPMAPNPVMGGHLTHVPVSRIEDVDMTVEQAVQYILTTGIVNTDVSTDRV